MIANFDEFVSGIREILNESLPQQEMLEKVRTQMGELVTDKEWFKETLSKLVLSEPFLQGQHQTIDPNDIQIYHSPDKSFTVSAYIWEPGVQYPIHDHGAWGVVGSLINPVKEIKYAVKDSGLELSFDEIIKTREAILQPGQTTYVLPLNQGIHQMAADEKAAVTIHLYGPRIRKGFIQIYHPETPTIQRIYRPSLNKKVLAIRTLGSIPDPWARDVLQTAITSNEPEFIMKECQLALENEK